MVVLLVRFLKVRRTTRLGNKHAYFHFRQVYYRIFVDTTAVIYANISLVLFIFFAI